MPSHRLVGNAASTFAGALYFKQTNVTWGGTNDTGDWTLLVADTITVEGNAVIPANSDFNNGAMTPPTRKVTLLE